VNPGIELRLLRYVVAVAEELHFSRAALRVRVAQPTLSKQIRDLEDGLGIRLFDRTNRQVRLTLAGRMFVKEARKALSHSERAVQLVKGASIFGDRLVSIGYSPQMNLRLLSIIRSLSTLQRPEFKLALISSHTNDQVEALLHGSIHVGLLTLPVRNESLVVKHLVREALAVVMPESHMLAAKVDIQARELNGLPVISIPRQQSPGFHDHLQGLFRKVGYRPNVVQEVTTEAEALYMVAEGMGIAFMKISSVPSERQGIAYRRLREPWLIEETGIAYRRDNRSRRLQGFIALLQTNVKGVMGNSLWGRVNPSPYITDPTQLDLF
jgi:DNA-binding transcriptional LysR family regulator